MGISGTAAATDYNASATQIVVVPGATSGSITITASQDDIDELDETVVIDIASVTGGNEGGVQQQTITIADDDVPPSFVVTSVEATTAAVRVEFNNELDGSDLNLYDTANAGLGPADVVVTGASSGAVAGSLIIDTSSVMFINGGGPLSADTYTVTLRSAADGFKGTDGAELDGDGDGTGGDDYVGNFTISEAPAGARTVSIPDFVRGPGLPGAPVLRLNQSPGPAADHDSTDSAGAGAPPTTAASVPHPAVDSVMTRLGDQSLDDPEEELLLALEDAVEELFAAL